METRIIRLFGIVQGVGFRPFTAVTAERFGIRGTVANKGSYVEIFAQGEPQQLDAFFHELQAAPPERAVILEAESGSTEKAPVFKDFSIIKSAHEPGNIFVSPDIATCEKCRRELFDPKDRRYLHPFINCTQCGPRLTILDAMPYDRERTSMREFPMCPDCKEEYENAETRRFDAQPVCCNNCGPEVYLIGESIRGKAAITAVRRAIMDGKIVAIKGIGGFHLCCDAKNEKAVARLRERKRRPMKPFAVMMRDTKTVERECKLTQEQRDCLTGWQKPILLLEKRENLSICDEIAPDILTVGVMLPYAPVQMLLFDFPDDVSMTDCLVMTSGNARGAPICRSDEDAQKEIGGFCDLMLSHNRNIRLRADDSVCDWLDGAPYMIRRSRGFAPLPIMLKDASEDEVLAIGGELKNSFCVAKGGLLYASPYVGDTADIRTVHALRESVDRMCSLLEAEPKAVVCDTHPLYNTVTVAQEIAEANGIPLIQVQHHYAHILSCMAENRFTGRVIGISLDGTGYGDDGTIWGGELLLCDPHSYERVGHIQPFVQSGGDLSAKEGWRIASALLREAVPDKALELCEKLHICAENEFALQTRMAELGINSVRSTSCGRLFDGISAILGIRRASTFEGEAAVALMTEAERYLKHSGAVQADIVSDIALSDAANILPTAALAAELAERFSANPSDENRQYLAYQFHAGLCGMIVRAVTKIRENTGISVCALSGGVFQNRLLTALTEQALSQAGFTVLRHHLIPPNDGGICIGQALYGVYYN